MKTPQTVHTIREFLTALEDPAKALTSWEQDFIISVTDQFDRTHLLSERQFEVLERIYTQKAP